MKNKPAFRAYLSAYHNEVTGSRLLVVVEFPDGTTRRILVDCGYFQEIKYRYLNYVDDLNPESIDAMIITHNHIDHTGLIPKFVRYGYSNKIYMTKITQELCPAFLRDCCEQQEENAEDMRQRYPDQADKFKPLYFPDDVERATDLLVGVSYRKTLEIFPGIKMTYFENGHILGAGMVLLQCHCDGMQDINFFFTGDYRRKNCFYEVPPLPKWLKKLPIIMVHESTYGKTDANEIKKCFRENILMALSKKMDILIGAFAQGRMQELLYFFKCLQEEGLIPKDYVIFVDGPLGIKTTHKYQAILSWYNPSKADFLPEGVEFVTGKERMNLLNDARPKIILTTSGMLSNGPAKYYVPLFLQMPNAMIHLAGYAAEETLARKLLDTKRDEVVKLGSQIIEKKCIVKTTRELSSHITADEGIEFINEFENIVFLAINHGEEISRNVFAERAKNETSVKDVGLVDRDNMYVFYQNATKHVSYTDMLIKRLPAKLNSSYELTSKQKELEKRRKRQEEKAEKKKNRNAAKKKRKSRKKEMH